MGSSQSLHARLADAEEGDVVTSAIAYAEVAHGAFRGKPPPIELLKAFLEEIAILSFDEAAGDAYAKLPFVRASYDRLIAAHAISRSLTVVTRNIKHFADIPELKVENWIEA